MNVVLPKLHEGQRLFLACVARIVVLVCGRRWGKTLVCLCMALLVLSEGKNVLWVGPVHRTIAMAWRRMHGLLAPLVAAGLVVFRESEMSLVWGKARMDFRSAEAGDNLRGEGNYALIVCDEAGQIPERVFYEVITPMRLDAPQSRMILAGTPRGTDDYFARLYRKGKEGAPGHASFQFASHTNPHLDRAELENAREDMAPTAYSREIEAQFVANDTVLFPVLVRGTPPECTGHALGCDLAISQKTSADHTCLCVCGRAADGTIWVLHAERGHWTMRETCQRIAATATAWSTQKCAVERVAYQAAAVDELERMPELAGITIAGVVPKGDKQSRAAPMSSRVASGAIRFADSLPEWFTSEVTGFPLARRDDAVDALQLAFTAANEDRGWLDWTAEDFDRVMNNVCPQTAIFYR